MTPTTVELHSWPTIDLNHPVSYDDCDCPNPEQHILFRQAVAAKLEALYLRQLARNACHSLVSTEYKHTRPLDRLARHLVDNSVMRPEEYHSDCGSSLDRIDHPANCDWDGEYAQSYQVYLCSFCGLYLARHIAHNHLSWQQFGHTPDSVQRPF